MIKKTEEEWKKELTPQKYDVLRGKATEMSGTGKLLHNKDSGMYVCGACGAELFDSKTKFESYSGWPSFYDAIPGSVEFHEDKDLGAVRTEVTCANCGSHLGHIFSDAPQQPTGKRYCINSIALDFKKKDTPGGVK